MGINLNKILDNNCLVDLLVGRIYPISDKYSDMPTSIDGVFEEIKMYYRKDKSKLIWDHFQNALVKLCDDRDYIFLVPLYIFSFFRFKQLNNEIFIDIEKIKFHLQKGIESNKSYLMHNDAWMGANVDGGLLQYINYIISLIENEFHVDMT